jgi:hypothetical protein
VFARLVSGVTIAQADREIAVIGVAPDTRNDQLDDRERIPPTAYLPYRYLVARNNGLIVRVRGGTPTSIVPAVRAEIRAADPTIAVSAVMTMDKVRALSFWQYGLFGAMFAVFGGIALILAAVGVYGVISYGVSQRTQEIGVRVALGAQKQHVIAIVIRQGMILASLGIAIGLVGSLGITRVVQSLLVVAVSPTDLISFGGVAAFLTTVALVASYLPARRATSVDPIIAARRMTVTLRSHLIFVRSLSTSGVAFGYRRCSLRSVSLMALVIR